MQTTCSTEPTGLRRTPEMVLAAAGARKQRPRDSAATGTRSGQAGTAMAGVVQPMTHPQRDVERPRRRCLHRYRCSLAEMSVSHFDSHCLASWRPLGTHRAIVPAARAHARPCPDPPSHGSTVPDTEEVTSSNLVRPTAFFENLSSSESLKGSQPPAVLLLNRWSEHPHVTV